LRWGLYFGVEDVSVKYLQFGSDNLFQVDVICTSYYSYMLLKGSKETKFTVCELGVVQNVVQNLQALPP